MTRLLAKLAVLALLLAGGALLIAWSGIVNVAASSGHWPITAWFLHYTLRQSVETHTLGLNPPPLEDPALVLRGAGHFESGCAPCHGAPGDVRAPIPQHMTPAPPYLPPRIDEWEPEELFWIVKHGIKFTGMPAWPTQHRDDEVWAMVAFLLRLPQLSAEAYRQLASGEVADDDPGRLRQLDDPLGPVLESCARCHGKSGTGRGLGAFPKLAGQNAAYLLASLRAFAQGERYSGIMQPVAAELGEGEMRELAEYFATRPEAPLEPEQPGTETLALGRRIAHQGIPSQGVPACRACHGPGDTGRNPFYPQLAGQYADYLLLQLELWQQGKRGGTAYAHIMDTIAKRLTKAQVRAVAFYYASLGAKTEERRQ
jgi:cytochrome c553